MTAVLDEKYNRRYTATSEFVLDGPAAGSDLLKTSADESGTRVLGTLNNCAGGVTPWGTFLSGEENFNQYFANAAAVADPTVAREGARYGITEGASERKWERLDPRFDMTQEPNEPNRFGWIVEVDPYDPRRPPVKHTALGRFKHEGATIRLTRDGRAVAYMGDDERFDYVYKFVSDAKMMKGESRRAREHNRTLLTKGTLYVAKFTGDSPAAEIDGSGRLPADGAFDGGGEWIKLAAGDRVVRRRHDGRGGVRLHARWPPTRWAPPRWTDPRTSRPTRTPGTCLHRAHQQHRPRQGRRQRAPLPPTSPTRATTTRTGTCIELVEAENDATAHERSAGRSCCSAATRTTRAPTSAGSTRARSARSPRRTTSRSTATATCGSPPTPVRRWTINDGLYGVSLEGPTRGRTTLFASVPAGGGVLWAGDHATTSC